MINRLKEIRVSDLTIFFTELKRLNLTLLHYKVILPWKKVGKKKYIIEKKTTRGLKKKI